MTFKKIIHLPVETKSGMRLGEVCGCEIDVERHVIERYIVKTSYLPRLLASELLVAASQVVSVSEEKMIVDDATAPAGAAAVTSQAT